MTLIKIHNISENWAYFVEHPAAVSDPKVGIIPLVLFPSTPKVDQLYQFHLRFIGTIEPKSNKE